MIATGSGGFGAISFDLSEWIVLFILVVLGGFAAWKIAKVLWAMFSG